MNRMVHDSDRSWRYPTEVDPVASVDPRRHSYNPRRDFSEPLYLPSERGRRTLSRSASLVWDGDDRAMDFPDICDQFAKRERTLYRLAVNPSRAIMIDGDAYGAVVDFGEIRDLSHSGNSLASGRLFFPLHSSSEWDPIEPGFRYAGPPSMCSPMYTLSKSIGLGVSVRLLRRVPPQKLVDIYNHGFASTISNKQICLVVRNTSMVSEWERAVIARYGCEGIVELAVRFSESKPLRELRNGQLLYESPRLQPSPSRFIDEILAILRQIFPNGTYSVVRRSNRMFSLTLPISIDLLFHGNSLRLVDDHEDLHAAGIRVHFPTLMGNVSYSLEPLLYRLVCKNGMVMPIANSLVTEFKEGYLRKLWRRLHPREPYPENLRRVPTALRIEFQELRNRVYSRDNPTVLAIGSHPGDREMMRDFFVFMADQLDSGKLESAHQFDDLQRPFRFIDPESFRDKARKSAKGPAQIPRSVLNTFLDDAYWDMTRTNAEEYSFRGRYRRPYDVLQFLLFVCQAYKEDVQAIVERNVYSYAVSLGKEVGLS